MKAFLNLFTSAGTTAYAKLPNMFAAIANILMKLKHLEKIKTL
jgi:hypothetical protein